MKEKWQAEVTDTIWSEKRQRIFKYTPASSTRSSDRSDDSDDSDDSEDFGLVGIVGYNLKFLFIC